MSNELYLPTGTTGQTISAKLYLSGAQVGSAIGMSEIASAGGVYVGSVPNGTGSGSYAVAFWSGATLVGRGSLAWNGTAEVTALSVPSDSSGVTTLLSRISSALTITSGKVDVNDKTGFSLSAAGIQAVWDALTTALTTVGSIGKRIVDYLDAAVTTRLAAASYTAPDNTSVAAIKAKTDQLPSDPASNTQVNTRLAASAYIAPDNSTIATLNTLVTAIKSKTDGLSFTGANINAVAQVVSDKTGYTLTTAERTAIATVVEASLLNDGDGQALINAIVTAIGNINIDQAVLIAAIRADLERAGGLIASRAAQATADQIKAKTDLIPANPAAVSNIPTVAQITDGVWDESQAGHTTNGTFGKMLDASVSSVSSGGMSPSQLAAAILDEAIGTHQIAGSVGKAIVDAGADSTGTTALLGRLTAQRAANLENLDVAVGSRGTSNYAGDDTAGVTELLARLTEIRAGKLDNLDRALSTLDAEIAAIKAKTDQLVFTAGNVNAQAQVVADKLGYGLSTTERSALVTMVEAALLNEADGQVLLEAIKQKIGNENVSELAIAGAVVTMLERVGGLLDSRAAQETVDAINAKTTHLPAQPAAVTDIPTLAQIRADLERANGKLDTRMATADYVAPSNADIAAIKVKTSTLPAQPAATGDIPTAAQNADMLLDKALAGHATSGTVGAFIAKIETIRAILQNKLVTDPVTGRLTIYADNGTTPLMTSNIFEDADGSVPYRGKGINRREKVQ